MEEKIKIIKKFILENVDCDAIVLFGSYARGTQNAESDIDIAIKPNTNIRKKQIFYLSQDLEEKIKTEEQKTYNELDYQAYLARKKK